MLKTIFPVSFEYRTIRIRILSIPLLFILHIISFILPPIIPLILAVPFHHPLAKVALVVPAIGPNKHPFAMHLIERPLPLKPRPIRPIIRPLPMLLPHMVRPLIVAPIVPKLHSWAFLEVVFEDSFEFEGEAGLRTLRFEHCEPVRNVFVPLPEDEFARRTVDFGVA